MPLSNQHLALFPQLLGVLSSVPACVWNFAVVVALHSVERQWHYIRLKSRSTFTACTALRYIDDHALRRWGPFLDDPRRRCATPLEDAAGTGGTCYAPRASGFGGTTSASTHAAEAEEGAPRWAL